MNSGLLSPIPYTGGPMGRQSMRVLSLIAAIVVPTLVAAAALAAPPTVGVLTFQPMPEIYKDAFRRSLREQGFVDGKDVTIDWRTGDGTVARIDQLAAYL